MLKNAYIDRLLRTTFSRSSGKFSNKKLLFKTVFSISLHNLANDHPGFVYKFVSIQNFI